MATISIIGGPWPPTTSVGIWPATARREGQAPSGSAIASASVGAASNSSTTLTVTDAGILQGVDYVGYAAVNGVHTYAQVRSTLDVYVAPPGKWKPGGTPVKWKDQVVARRAAIGTS